jgi:hypothetical protein
MDSRDDLNQYQTDDLKTEKRQTTSPEKQYPTNSPSSGQNNPPLPRGLRTSRPIEQAGNSSQALISIQQSVKADMEAALSDSTNQPVSIMLPQQSQKSPAGLTIIPGSGRIEHQLPYIPQQPRSQAINVALVSIIACTIIAILYASAPLATEASNHNGNGLFGSGAGMVAAPTLTPTPTPTPIPIVQSTGSGHEPNPGAQVVKDEIVAVFGSSYSTGALNIAKCESGYDPNAYNTIAIMGSHAAGVFQILYPSTWKGTSYRNESPYNYKANIRAAYEIFTRDGYSWREWACKS